MNCEDFGSFDFDLSDESFHHRTIDENGGETEVTEMTEVVISTG